MSDDTLTALSQRDGAFWVGLALLLAGSLVHTSVRFGDAWLGTALVGLGVTLLAVRLLVALYRLSRTSVAAGKAGYDDARQRD